MNICSELNRKHRLNLNRENQSYSLKKSQAQKIIEKLEKLTHLAMVKYISTQKEEIIALKKYRRQTFDDMSYNIFFDKEYREPEEFLRIIMENYCATIINDTETLETIKKIVSDKLKLAEVEIRTEKFKQCCEAQYVKACREGLEKNYNTIIQKELEKIKIITLDEYYEQLIQTPPTKALLNIFKAYHKIYVFEDSKNFDDQTIKFTRITSLKKPDMPEVEELLLAFRVKLFKNFTQDNLTLYSTEYIDSMYKDLTCEARHKKFCERETKLMKKHTVEMVKKELGKSYKKENIIFVQDYLKKRSETLKKRLLQDNIQLLLRNTKCYITLYFLFNPAMFMLLLQIGIQVCKSVRKKRQSNSVKLFESLLIYTKLIKDVKGKSPTPINNL